jgi:hypothetical protein
MPDSLRHFMRAKQHPARSVVCPHCGAHAHKPCRLRTQNRLMAEPHPQRVSAWVQLSACCPECQVTPGTPCHEDGRALAIVHDRRQLEAEVTAA